MKIKNWKKIVTHPQHEVWFNGTYRVVLAKGDKKWNVWRELPKGRIGSDEAHIPNSWIAQYVTRDEGRKVARMYMHKNGWFA